MTLRVFVLGSCVTRDVFETLPTASGITLAGYVARTSLASVTGHVSGARYDPEQEASPFRRRMVETDLGKRFISLLDNVRWDVLVIDFVDERFNLLVDSSGGITTLSSEFKAGHIESPGERTVASASEEHFALWHAGLGRLKDVLIARQKLGSVRINAPAWAERLETGEEIPGTSLSYIRRSNQYQARLVGAASDELGCPVWSYADSETRAAKTHQWGQSPFHYGMRYYDCLAENLSREAARLA